MNAAIMVLEWPGSRPCNAKQGSGRKKQPRVGRPLLEQVVKVVHVMEYAPIPHMRNLCFMLVFF
jgi:hypothetical protein